MKKIYMIPEIEVVKVETAMVLAESTFSLFRSTTGATTGQNESGDYEYENAH